jgi:hypothetical protein
LTTIVVSIAALWILGSFRFRDQPASNPVAPVLSQLASRSVFDELPAAMFQLESRLSPLLVALPVERPRSNGTLARETLPALRIDTDLAVAMLRNDPGSAEPMALPEDVKVVVYDPASRLAVVHVSLESAPPIPTWSPPRPQYPRYLITGDVSPYGVSLRPVYMGPLHAIASSIWEGSIWTMSAAGDLLPGAFMFTTDGALAGLVVDHEGRLALVPGELVLNVVNRLRRAGPRLQGRLGVQVQALTPSLTAATGATTGVIVTAVDPNGPAAAHLAVTDVIEAVNDEAVGSYDQWQSRVAGVTPGETVSLRVRSRNEVRQVSLVAGPVAGSTPRPLGLTMRDVPQVGVEVLQVDPWSAAALAALRSGDVITVIGRLRRPTPSQVRQAFDSAPDDHPILVAITRGESHHVVALAKR